MFGKAKDAIDTAKLITDGVMAAKMSDYYQSLALLNKQLLELATAIQEKDD